MWGYNGDGIVAQSAELCDPTGVAVDAAGDIFIADCYNNRIREVNAATDLISTVAGNGTTGYNGDNSRGQHRRVLSAPGGRRGRGGERLHRRYGQRSHP